MKRYIVKYGTREEWEFLNKTQAINYIKSKGCTIEHPNANGPLLDSNKKFVGYFTIKNLKDYLCLGGEMNGKKLDSDVVRGYGYIMFNSGVRNSTKHSAVFIHESLL